MNDWKRATSDDGFSSNGGFFKKPKQELESVSTGVRSKLEPCIKFFSTVGCPFGENCHFQHYFPGGYDLMTRDSITDGSAHAIETRPCRKYNSAEGCKYGDRCHFSHNEREPCKSISPSRDHHRAMGSRFAGESLPSTMSRKPPPRGPASGFGTSATSKISIGANLAGAIIGKGGMNSREICRRTGVKLSVRDHGSDPNLKNVELEGTYEQISEASAMVKELVGTVASAAAHKTPSWGRGTGRRHYSGRNLKSKMCEKYATGTCNYGERCHFAHSELELREAL